ncbi:MAG: hypothetical protein RL329_2982 [Bacteroidota bacterium]
MKKYIFKRFGLCLFLFLCCWMKGIAQNGIQKFFEDYTGDEKFTEVIITPKMFQMIARLDLNDPDAREIKNILADLKSLHILTTANNPNFYYKDALTRFKSTDYETLMTVRSKEENIRFLTKEDSKGLIKELLLLVGGKTEFVLISFVGNIDLNKISQLANKLDVKGMEHLKDLNKK